MKIAVIGIGRWGVHLLRNFLAHPQASVVAVLDPQAERLAAIKQQFNLDENILLTTQWSALQQVPGLTAVAMATPATTHYALIKQALNLGYHVLAEKPLTLDPLECLELCQLAEKQHLILMVDHTYLFHPAVQEGQTVVKVGTLGNLRYGYATRTHLGPVRQDVDALWDLAIHDIAIFNNWLGQIPVKVQATGTVWLQGVGNGEFNHFPSGLADLVWVTLTYPHNFQAYIHLCWGNPDKQRRLAIVGSRGCLIFDEMSPSSPLTLLHGEFERQANQFLPVNQKREVLEFATAEPLQRVCDLFILSIIQNTPPDISSGWVGTTLVQILSGLTTSLNQGGQAVIL
ncbi:Gfo/Idh/MocA family protein [Umezakia ovalisporum]|jgi:predicted dehydrogenase|uniref:Gfo/Idh/MocA family oxidoreductase n=2 Tax=Umezakia ovalisporum TaxID=75695 RepID=A0AA43GY89_9CYAN|nr:Gfo/Idh/MocA family oxidoreductase [Umezakia ovalisporum]MBI1242819.1 gfo/Idh/MocA family oxidoreductase [Nostoc sp. RI_552]MDH6058678.1 Gfo/Idh/MocA family oxidoreductase [Umezakia ovalisporum FSS-43]MDH6063668.1 Gfo/Idh/MocA family oxidoreductase [Umezakia ovalisporum FSS-62]MDH6067230.1 Gfo/Idh/MocA family oxidoreductase [Umezakia ovalisporum APH033B]MDH6070737.1 Gfo/Idh/MocA family oxidoreductase [Umezakia ovalisporum CobakiLakeA]